MQMNIQRRAFIAGSAALAAWPRSLFADAPARAASVWENADGTATDSVMARRLHLDLAGRIPTKEEAQAYAASDDPGKRAALVERLLASDGFADFWAMRFCDILRVKSEFPINLWPNAVYVYHARVRRFVAANEPWDEFGRELLVSQGSDFRDAEVNFFRATDRRTPEGWAEAVAQTFLGIAPDALPAERRASMARHFATLRIKNTREWKEEIVYLDPSQDGPTPAAFADYLLGPARDKFARAFVQRVDWWMLGLEKPDPAHVAIFRKNGFRLKPLVRAIAMSRAYGRGSITGGFPCRRLDAEVLDDMICDLTNTKRDYQSIAPEPFTFLPKDRRSILIEDGSISNAFLLLFGRPARDTGLLSERHNEITAKQRLYLFNSGKLFRILGRITDDKAFRSRPMRAIVQDLYWRFLSRPALPAEVDMLVAHHSGLKGGARWRFPRDVAWSLMNTREFLYQH